MNYILCHVVCPGMVLTCCRCVILQPMLGQPKLWKLPKAAAKMAGRGLKDVQAPSMAAFLAPVHQAGKAGSTSSGQPRTALLGLADGDGWVFTWDPWVSRTGKLLQPAASSSRPVGKSSKAAGAATSPNKLVDACGKSLVGNGDPSNCSVQVVSAAGVNGSSSAVLQTNDAAGIEKRLKAVRKKIRQAEELGRVASTQLQGAGASSSSAIGLSAEQQRKLESLPVLRQEAEDLAVLLAALNT